VFLLPAQPISPTLLQPKSAVPRKEANSCLKNKAKYGFSSVIVPFGMQLAVFPLFCFVAEPYSTFPYRISDR
jgi:hypothetical protein